MPFPESSRVLYDENPLTEVICQLTFPSILRIDSQKPFGFQERIRTAFPIFAHQVVSPVQGLVPAELASLVSGISSYQFVSEDSVWRLTLTREFLALTTSKYSEWSDFKQRLEEPIAALLAEYQPAFFQRIGLRYRDVILRSKLGLADVPWSDLVRPEVVGELGSELAPLVTRATRELILELPESSGNVRIVHGLDVAPQGEHCYVIDCDFYAERKTGINEAPSVLDKFNGRAGSLFRWCILPKLHNAMRPRAG